MAEKTPSFLTFAPALAQKLRDGDAKFILTGGGGWMGQAALEMLDQALGDALPGRVAVFGARAKTIHLRSGKTIASRALAEMGAHAPEPRYFLHFAYLTKDRASGLSERDYIEANEAISRIVAEAMRHTGCRGLFMPSSGAACHAGSGGAMGLYGSLKAADEKIFSALAAEMKIPAVMPRVFNLAGPFMNKVDLYALGSMIRDVLNGDPIAIRAAHPVVRSYVHVADVINLAVAMLLEPLPGQPVVFDTAGDETPELSDLAHRIIDVLGKHGTEIVRPPLDDAKTDWYVGQPGVMSALAGQYGFTLRPLEAQIQDTAAWLAGPPKADWNA